MQVTKAIFPAVFPLFRELLGSCDFYAIDEEMTGISFKDGEENPLLTPDETYERKRPAASTFSLIQVGISLFHKVPNTVNADQAPTGSMDSPVPVAYEARPFNFIVFPDYSREIAWKAADAEVSTNKQEGDNEAVSGFSSNVVLGPSGIQFHRRMGMDFQSWVYDGISYCNTLQKQEWQKHLDQAAREEVENQASGAAVLPGGFSLSSTEEEWVNQSLRIAQKMQKELLEYEEQCKLYAQQKDRAENTTSTSTGESDSSEIIDISSIPTPEKESRIPAQTSKVLHKHLIALLKNEAPNVSLGTSKSGACWLTLHTNEDKRREKKIEDLSKIRKTHDLFGFQLVFEALVQCGKPCVGHNCFLDFLFLMAIMDRPLPPTLLEWKHQLHKLFPLVYDTKYLSTRSGLCSGNLLQPNSLLGLFKEYGLESDHVKIVLPLGFQAYDTLSLLCEKDNGASRSHRDHEAGYDALMTGTILANLIHANGFSGVDALPDNCVNKIALFASLYSLLLTKEGDEYLPEDYSVISLESEQKADYHHFVRCLNQVGANNSTIFFVNVTRVLCVLPPNLKEDEILTKLQTTFQNIRASKYSPPPTKVPSLRPKVWSFGPRRF